MKKLTHLSICLPLLFTMCAVSPAVNAEKAGGLAIYGNWCGPNHPKDVSSSPEPIDALDAACMRHDICYEDKGYLDCKCDSIFRGEINRDLKERLYDTEQSIYAKSARAHFAVSPCDGNGEGKAGPSRILHGIYNGAKVRFTRFVNRFTDDEEVKTGNSQNDSADIQNDNP